MSFQFFKILLFSLFYFTFLAQTQLLYSQIKSTCGSFDLDEEQTSTHKLSKNRTKNITQTNCVEFFKFNIANPSLLDKYLIFEVKFQNLPKDLNFKPLVLENNGEKPRLAFNDDNSIDFDTDNNADSDAFFNRKLYHYIIVKPGDFSYNDTLYLGVYKVSTSSENDMNIPLEYNIRVRASKNFPCPQNCNKRGVCSNSLKKCICKRGFFDIDCGIEAAKIEANNFASKIIAPNSKGLFYLLLTKEHLEGFELVLDKSSGLAKFIMAFDGPNDYTLPHNHDPLDRTSINNTEPQLIFTIPKESLEDKEKYTLVVEAVNPQPEDMIVRVKVSNDTENKPTWILLVVVGASVSLLLIWMTVTLIKGRTGRLQRLRVRNDVERNLEQKIENIEKYCPNTNFEKLTSSFPQNTCSVCLEDFSSDSVCRQLYCEHIFHSQCIDSWLGRHNNCPNCKKIMTKDILEKIYDGSKETPLDGIQSKNNDNDIKIEVIEASTTNSSARTRRPTAQIHPI